MLNLVVIRARDIDRLATFYSVLGCNFAKHRHGDGPEHLSSEAGGIVFEIYRAKKPEDSTTSARLGFNVPSLTKTLEDLRNLGAAVVVEPADTPFGRRAVVKDFEGHKVELYEKTD